jgi:fibronectin-binding autotransporter adhesin
MRRKNRGHRAARIAVAVLPVVAALGTPHAVCAALLYWDLNGATAGAGSATPSGTWNGANSNWSSASAGNVAPQTYTSGSTAVFSAGTDATGSYTVTVSGTQTAAGITFEEGTVTLSGGTVSLSSSTVNVASGAGATINSILAGASNLTKTGNGTLTLGATNSFTGTVQVNAGEISVNADDRLGNAANAITLGGSGASGTLIVTQGFSSSRVFSIGLFGGRIDVDASQTLTLLSALGSSSNFLNKDGGGTLVLTAASTRSGSTNVNSGVVRVENATALGTAGSGTLTIFSVFGGTLEIGGVTIDKPMTLQGTLRGTGTAQSNGTISVSNSAATLSTGGIGDVLTIGNAANDLTGGGASSSINVSGSGKVALGQSSNYTGNWNLTSGTLEIGADDRLGVTGNGVTFAGGILSTTATISTARGMTLNSGGGTFNVAASMTLTASSAIGGTGGLTKIGAGTLLLSGANSYAGGTTINAGTLGLGTSNVLADGGAVTLADVASAALDVNGNTETIGALSGGGASGGNIMLGAGALTVSQTTNTVYAGIISGSPGSLTKSGSGALTLTGVNTYSGGTTISAGTLTLGASAVLADSGAVTVAGGTLALGTFSDTVAAITLTSGSITGTGGVLTGSSYAVESGTVSAILGGSAALTKSTINTVTLSAANTYSGGTTINGGALVVSADNNLGGSSGGLTFGGGTLNATTSFSTARAATLNSSGGTFDVNSGMTLSASGVISGTGGLTKSGTGTLTLSGVNTYTGGTTVSAGTLALGANDVLANSGAVNVNGGILDVNTRTDTVGAVTLTSGAISGTGGVLTGLSYGVESGSISAILSGSAALTKSNVGTVTLSAANTYSGGTTINGGTLIVTNASALGTASPVATVNAATLQIGGVTLSGNITLNNGAKLTGGGRFPAITVASGAAVTLDGSAGSVDVGPLSGGAGATVTVTGNFFGVDLATPCSYSGDWNINGDLSVTGAVTVLGSQTNSVTLTSGLLYCNPSPDWSTTRVIIPNGGTLGIQTGKTITLSNALGAGSGSFTKDFPGTLNLGPASARTGTTNIVDGTVVISNTDALGSGSITIGGTLPAFPRLGLSGISGFNKTVALQDNGGLTGGSGSSIVSALAIPSGADVRLGGLTIGDGANDLTGGGGGSSITTDGGGTLILAYPSNYVGNWDIDEGSVQIDADDRLGNAANNISMGGTFSYGLITTSSFATSRVFTISSGTSSFEPASGTTFTVNSALAGTTGTLNKYGAGTLVLTTSSTRTGSTFVKEGTLRMTNGNAAGTGSIALQDTGTLELAGVNAAGFISLSDATTLRGTGSAGSNFNTNVQSGATVTLATGSNPADVLSIANTTNFLGNGGGGATITIAGAGTVNIGAANNTLVANWIINSGTLQIGGNDRLGNAANTVTFNGGALSLSTSLTLARTTALNVPGGTINIPATPTVATASGVISGTGAFTKSGTGTLVLTNANTYAGGTTISGGTLQIGDFGTTGSITGDVTNSGTITFARSNAITYSGVISGLGTVAMIGTGTLVLSGANTYGGSTVTLDGTLQVGGGSTSGSIAGDITNNAALAFNRSNAIAYAGLISGVGSLTKLGAGTLTLSGSNSYSGGTTVSAGTLAASGANVLGSGAVTVSGGSLNIGSFYENVGAVTLASGSIDGTSGTLQATSFSVQSGSISAILFGSSVQLTKSGAGTVTLSGANSYTGFTNINAGTLSVSSNANLGASSAQLSFGGGTLNVTGSFSMNRSVTLNSGGGTFDIASGNAVTLSGIIANGNGGGLTKIGSGTLTLTASNSYSGPTTINAGTLRVNGSPGTGISSVSVNSGATLGGTGAINAGVTVNSGGHLAPGASIGTLTVNTLTLSSGSLLDYELGAPSSGDKTVILGNTSGSLVLNGGTFSFIDNGIAVGDYVLLDYAASSFSGSLSNLSIAGSPPAGLTWSLVNDSPTTNILLRVLAPAVVRTWNVDGSGNWSNAGGVNDGNWSPAGGPNSPDSVANFSATSPNNPFKTVTISDADKTVGTINFDSTSGYQVSASGANKLIIDTTGGDGAINVNSGSHTITAPVLLNKNTTVNVAGANALTMTSQISGSRILTKSGAGTLLPLGANTYSGGTVITGGVLEISSDANLGTAPLTSATNITLNGGTLRLAGTPSVFVDIGPTRGITIGAAGGTLDVTDADLGNEIDSIYVGNISGSGRWTKSGAGELLLDSNNSYSGGLQVTGGTLKLGTVGGSSNETASPTPGTLRPSGAEPASTDADWVILDGGNLRSANTGNGVTFLSTRKGITLGPAGGGVWVDDSSDHVAAQSTSYFGKVSGAAVLYKRGTGEFRPNRVNIGDTWFPWENTQLVIEAGFYRIGNNGLETGFGAVPASYDDDAIYLNGAGPDRFNNGVAIGMSATLTTPSARGIKIGGNGATFVLNALSWTIDSIISGPGALQLDGNGWTGLSSSTLVLRGNNSWGGSTMIKRGTLAAQLGNAIPDQSAVTLDEGASATTVQLRIDNDETIGSLASASSAICQVTLSSGASLTTGANNASTTFGGLIIGAGSLIKSGSGTMMLSNANTYAGNTTINAGTLSVANSGNLGASSNGIIFNGGTLAATGTIASATRNVTVQAGNGTIDTAANGVTVGNVDGAGNFNKSGSGTLTANRFRVNNLTINAGIANTLAVANPASSASVTPGISKVNSLIVNGSATVNLTNNRIITNDAQGTESGSIYSGVQGLVQSGKIFTDQALAGSNQTAIGVATAAEAKGLVGTATTLWSGQTIDSNDTLVMYTWAGDANLDGKVNADDYASIDLYSTVPGADSWNHGDFNYNGVINADDYALIDNNVQNLNYVPYWTTDAVRDFAAESSGLTAVPEPALGLAGIALLPLMRRRRR